MPSVALGTGGSGHVLCRRRAHVPHLNDKHTLLLKVYNASDVTLNTYLKLLEMECPEGVIVTLTGMGRRMCIGLGHCWARGSWLPWEKG